jgi:hypothetical protein
MAEKESHEIRAPQTISDPERENFCRKLSVPACNDQGKADIHHYSCEPPHRDSDGEHPPTEGEPNKICADTRP